MFFFTVTVASAPAPGPLRDIQLSAPPYYANQSMEVEAFFDVPPVDVEMGLSYGDNFSGTDAVRNSGGMRITGYPTPKRFGAHEVVVSYTDGGVVYKETIPIYVDFYEKSGDLVIVEDYSSGGGGGCDVGLRPFFVACCLLWRWVLLVGGGRMRHKWMRLCGVLLVLGLMFCCGTTFAAEDAAELESWIDYAADGFAGGTGTEDDPYLIATAEQLAYLAKTTNDGSPYESSVPTRKTYKDTYFRLIADIDLHGKEWHPIGTYRNIAEIGNGVGNYFARGVNIFAGHFDGGGYVISNLTINRFLPESGLFGIVRDGELCQVKLQNIRIKNGYYAGGLAAGYCSNYNISGCSIEGSVSGFYLVGGLVGFSEVADVDESIVFDRCYVSLDIRATFKRSEKYEENHPTLRLFWPNPTSGHPFLPICGGIVGFASSNTQFKDCRVNATAEGDFYLWGSIVGKTLYGYENEWE